MVQRPITQLSPAAQRRPQLPQWVVLDEVSQQAPSQQLLPAMQLAAAPHRHSPVGVHVSPVAHGGAQAGSAHAPATHSWPAAHGSPQAPQCAAEVVTFTHTAPQHVSPVGHAAPPPQRHSPVTQERPAGAQMRPHAPQFSGSLGRSAHTPSQHICPPLQGASGPQPGRQAPSRHTCPVGQLIGHAGPASPAPGPASTRPGPASTAPGPESMVPGPASVPAGGAPSAQPASASIAAASHPMPRAVPSIVVERSAEARVIQVGSTV